MFLKLLYKASSISTTLFGVKLLRKTKMFQQFIDQEYVLIQRFGIPTIFERYPAHLHPQNQ